METALKNNVQIRHPKEEVEDVDDHDRGPMEELVQEKFALGKGRYRCKLSVGGSELCFLGQMIIRECNSADPELVPLRRTRRNIIVPPEASSG